MEENRPTLFDWAIVVFIIVVAWVAFALVLMIIIGSIFGGS